MIKQKITLRNVIKGTAAGVVSSLVFSGMVLSPFVAARNFQAEINQLNSTNSDIRDDVDNLEDDATSLEDKINRLQAKINVVQKQIDDNQRKIAELKKQIARAEAELERQRDLLGANIRAMYLEGDISTLEMLASSSDLSEFIDKEQYRNAVQDKIKVTLDKVNKLKHELDQKEQNVEKRLNEQKRLNTELVADRSENNRLLSLNETEQNALDSKIKKNNKKIEELKRLQFLENAARFGSGGGIPGGGGYPWGNARCIHNGSTRGYCPNYDWAFNGSLWNPATGGYGYRNCTDWVSYRVRSTGRFVPGGLGNASSWDDRAPSYGFKVSNTPKVGSAGVYNSGYYGHVVYVEAVNSDGTITISDYNRAGPGEYGVKNINPAGLRFVYF